MWRLKNEQEKTIHLEPTEMAPVRTVRGMDRVNNHTVGMTKPVLSTTVYATTSNTAVQAYVPRGQIHATDVRKAVRYKIMPLVSESSVKRYMDVSCVTDTSSKQYRLLQRGVIGNDGLIRVNGYICAAVGQKYGRVGDRFVFTIGGRKVKIIMADAKRNCDTINGWTDKDGNILEMIVSTGRLNDQSRRTGDCNYTDAVRGKITEIRKEK